MKIRVLFLAIAMSAISLKGMELAEKTEQSHLYLPQEMIELVKQLESCKSFDEQLKEIGRLRTANRYFNQLFSDASTPFMKLVLGALGRNLTQEENVRLCNAAENGQAWLVKVMLKLGADVNMRDNSGWTALHCAADGEHTQLAKLLIATKGVYVNAKDNYGWTALHRVACIGHLEIAKLLITNGANVNMQDNRGWTALHRAAYNGHTQLAKLLIAHGANVNAKDNNGWTALHRATCNGYLEIAKLLTNGANVNMQDNRGWTALHRVAYNGHLEIAKLLIAANGFDINMQDNKGWTALHYAAKNGQTQLAKLLIAHGANVNAKNNSGQTALHKAARNKHLEIAKALLEHGAVNQESRDGRTALSWAKTMGHTKIASLIGAAISAASVSHSALTNFVAPKAEAID